MEIRRVDSVNDINNLYNRERRNSDVFKNKKSVKEESNDSKSSLSNDNDNILYIEDIIKLYENIPINDSIKYKFVGYIYCKLKSTIVMNSINYYLIDYDGAEYIIDSRDLKKKNYDLNNLNRTSINADLNVNNLNNYNKRLKQNNLNRLNKDFI